jgi:hypothetical protein
MRIADLSTGAGQLRDAMDKLQLAWTNTQDSWNDNRSRELSENHLQPLAIEVAGVQPAIQNLASILAQAERDCSPWS